MSRRKKKIKGHFRQPDPRFSSPIVSHLINKLMRDGEKIGARKTVYQAAEIIEGRSLAFKAIESELNQNPSVATHELDTKFQSWENQIIRFSKAKDINEFKEKILSEIKKIRAKKLSTKGIKEIEPTTKAEKTESTSELSKTSAPLFLTILEEALKNVTPTVEMKRQRAGAGSYRTPHKISPERGQKIALRWIVQSLRERPKKPAQADHQFKKWKRKPSPPMFEKLADEIIRAANKDGKVFEKWQTLQKEAEVGRAFLR